MASEYVLAIDVGTQSTRAALVAPDGGALDTASSPIELFTPHPGWAEQDPEQWWATTVANIAALTGRHPGVPVAAVCTGAQMHSLVALGADGSPLGGRAAIWSDKRCTEQVQEFLRLPDAKELAARAANPPLPAWSGFKMAWLRRHRPDAYSTAVRFLVAKDFVNWRLCGEAATDPSEASGSFLYDASTGAWSEPLTAALGVPRAKLPDIVGSATVIGAVGKEVSRATGLSRGVPVVAGSGDMMCQLLGAGLTCSGRVSLVTGTSSIVSTAADQPSTDERVMNLRSASGTWIRFGIGDSGGVALRWFVDSLYRPSSGQAPSEVPAPLEMKSALDRLNEEAAGVEAGSDGLLFFPYLLGERTLGDDRSRASFVGATLRHGRAHFARAVMEGIALEDRRSLECVCPHGPVGPVRCTGGGATSRLWNQMRADVFGHPVQTLSGTEGGIRGAAILAGVGAGWYPDACTAADQLVRPAETWHPRADAAVYDGAFRTFCAVHDALGTQWHRWGEGGSP